MALKNNTRGSSNSQSNSAGVVRLVDPKLYRLMSSISPFLRMMNAITGKRNNSFMKGSKGKGNKNVTNPKFEWNELDLGTPHDLAQAEYSAVATEIVVVKANMFTINDIIFVRSTEEQMLVTDVTVGTNTLTVTRGFAGTTAAIIPDDEVLILQGSAFAEGSLSAKALSFSPEELYNYTEIFKQSVENTRTGMQTMEYGDQNKITQMRINAFEIYTQKKARQYMFGKRYATVDADNNPVRTTNGLNNLITSNLIDMTAGVTYSAFMDMMEQIMMYGGEERVLFASSKLVKAIQLEVLDGSEFAVSPKSKEYGIDIAKLKTTFGDIHITHDRTLDYYAGGAVTGLGFALELENVHEMVMEADSWHDNVQENDRDGRKDQIIGESGLKLMLEQRHAKIIM